MGEQIRDKITAGDCLAYAEACEQWATHAPDEAARRRLHEMARSWRDLERHMTEAKAGAQTDERRRAGKVRSGKASADGMKRESRTGTAGRRSH